MKIISIRLKNFNSLKGEQDIDFTQDPLGSAGLFVITGPTGSGKSTILDAITLALYGRIPRIKQKVINHKLVEQDGIILTRHTDDCFTEVVYEVKGKRYRSSWTMSRNRNKKLNDRKQELFDMDADCILTDKNDDVIKKNEEIIGLNYEQFVQSLILAQGKFAKLLQSARSERNALLESITGTEIYREIGKRVFERSSKALRMVEDQKQLMKGIELLTDEEEVAFREDLEKKEPIREGMQKERTAIQALITLKSDLVKLSKKLEENVEDFKGLEAQEEALQNERIQLKKHDEMAVFRAEVNAIEQEDSDIKKLNKNCLDWKGEIEKLQASNLQLLKASEQLLKDTILEDELIDRVLAFRKNIQDTQAKIEDEQAKLTQVENDIQRLLVDLGKEGLILKLSDLTEQQIHDEMESVHARIALLNVHDLADLIAKRDDLRKSYQPATELRSNRKENDRDMADLKDKRDGLMEKEDRLRSAHVRHAELKDLVQKTNDEREKAQKELEKLKAEKGLAALRNDLVPGESCPLCGSLEHPYHEQYEDKLLSTYERLFNKAKDDHTFNNNEFIILEGTMRTLQLEIGLEGKSITAKEEELQKRTEQLQKDCIPFGWDLTAPLSDWDAAINQMNAQIVALEEGEKEFSKKDILDNLLIEFVKIEPINSFKMMLSEQLCEKYSGKNIEKDTQDIVDTRRENNVMLEDRLEQLKKAEDDAAIRKKTLTLETDKLLSRMNAKGIKDFETYRLNLLDETLAQEVRSRLKDVDDKRVALASTKNTLEKDIKELREKDDLTKDADTLILEANALTDRINQLSEEIGKSREKLDRNDEDKLKLQDSQDVLNQLKKDLALWGRMNELIGEKTGNRFANFVQDLTFEQLIDFGNKRLVTFSDRYLLTMSNSSDSGDLHVMDTYMGNTVRSIFSLSGGETFKLSLALALGLSDLAARKVEIESLFIDEGFGSLDPDSLEEAISLLEDIQHQGNKSIGIISHVSELKDRIGTKVKLVPQGSGYSTIVVE